MKRILEILHAVLLLALTGLLISATLLVLDVRAKTTYTLENLNRLIRESGATMGDLRHVAEAMKKESEAQAGYWATNSQKVTAILEEGRLAVAELRLSTAATNDALTTTIAQTGDGIEGVTTEVQKTLARVQPAIENFNVAAANAAKVLGDPNIPKTLDQVAQTTEQVNLTAQHVEHSTALIEKKVEQTTKPASWAYRVGTAMLGFTVSAAQIAVPFLRAKK